MSHLPHKLRANLKKKIGTWFINLTSLPFHQGKVNQPQFLLVNKFALNLCMSKASTSHQTAQAAASHTPNKFI